MKLTMHVDLANAILAYLGKRPHDEVRGLIDAIQGMQPISEKAESPSEKEKEE